MNFFRRCGIIFLGDVMNFKSKTAVLFDLDGTVINSKSGIFASIRYVEQKLGLPQKSDSELRYFIGPPILHSFEKYYNMSYEKAVKATEIYREYYADTGVYMFSVYDGLIDTLNSLKIMGKRLYICTCKPEKFAKLIIEKAGIDQLFDGIYGIELSGHDTTKAQVLNRLLESEQLSKNDCVLIGDTKFDVIGAKKCAVSSIGVRYGFASENELENEYPDAIVNTTAEILSLF